MIMVDISLVYMADIIAISIMLYKMYMISKDKFDKEWIK